MLYNPIYLILSIYLSTYPTHIIYDLPLMKHHLARIYTAWSFDTAVNDISWTREPPIPKRWSIAVEITTATLVSSRSISCLPCVTKRFRIARPNTNPLYMLIWMMWDISTSVPQAHLTARANWAIKIWRWLTWRWEAPILTIAVP